MVQEIDIEEVRFDKEIYPRSELDNQTVNQYRLSIDSLPPILLTHDKRIIDGYHRLTVFKLEGRKTIPFEYFESDDEKDIILESIKRNSSHGRQLSMKEKAKLALKLYTMDVPLERIIEILSVGKRKVYDWTESAREKEKSERDAKILELYLQCWTQERIAEEVKENQATVSRTIMQICKNAKLHNPDNLQLYNTWSIGQLDANQLKYPGQTPIDILENIVYYYSEPFDKVVDPMGGSGALRDVCVLLMRRYMMFDIRPLREDIPIIKNDILKGFPDEAKDADLVYFDPPYFNLMSEYPDNEFTKDYDSFMKAVKTSLKNIKMILNPGGKVAIILKPMSTEMFGDDWLDMSVDTIVAARSQGYKLIKRIAAPYSTQQFTASDVTRAKERKVMLNTLRDIIIVEA